MRVTVTIDSLNFRRNGMSASEKRLRQTFDLTGTVVHLRKGHHARAEKTHEVAPKSVIATHPKAQSSTIGRFIHKRPSWLGSVRVLRC